MHTSLHYIRGCWIPGEAASPRTGEALNPATSEVAALYAEGTAADAQAAVAAARNAFETTPWRHSPRVRADLLLAFADRLEARREEVADWLVTLNGKLRREAMGEIMAGVSELRYYAGLARNLGGRVLEVEPQCYSQLDREAAGVAVIILPWNAPVTLLVRSLAPALAAGCTAVLKPAHQTARVHNLVLECIVDDPRLPPGVINSVIESGAEVSRALCADPEVDVISFTGSSAVGKQIARDTAPLLTRLSLELGGKAPAVVLADCDVDRAVQGIVASGMVMAGQQCTAIARVLVEEPLFDTFAARLRDALAEVRVGPGNDPASQMGCLIDLRSRDRIDRLVQEAGDSAQVRRVHLRGRVGTGALARGAFISPSLIEVEDLGSRYVQDELFGPLLVIERFADEDAAVARANATRYGLAASVWGRDTTRARRIARRLRSGTVWMNSHNRLFAEAETGGSRDSGYGRLHGVQGLDDFLHTKHVYYELSQ
jgi:betaine-aldehyde dehydrogenase